MSDPIRIGDLFRCVVDMNYVKEVTGPRKNVSGSQIGWELERHYLPDGSFLKAPGSWERERTLLDPEIYLRLYRRRDAVKIGDPSQPTRSAPPLSPPALRGCTNDEIDYLRTLARQLDLIGLSSMLNLTNNEILARGREERKRGR